MFFILNKFCYGGTVVLLFGDTRLTYITSIQKIDLQIILQKVESFFAKKVWAIKKSIAGNNWFANLSARIDFLPILNLKIAA